MPNLLQDSFIPYSTTLQGKTTGSLQEVLAALSSTEEDQVITFSRLQSIQQVSWHTFLTQLAAICLQKANFNPDSTMPTDPADWLEMLRSLTKKDHPQDEPWELLNPEAHQPAFMQPPLQPYDTLKDYKGAYVTPDQMDIYVKTRNHDRKIQFMANPTNTDWLHALINIQTTSGFDGNKLYGISKLPTGLGNRPTVSLVKSQLAGDRFRFDTSRLLQALPYLLDNYPMTLKGIPLIWTIPWGGQASEALTLEELHPFYIEIARRIRLRRDQSNIMANYATAYQRIKFVGGKTGDPWIPTSTDLGANGNPKSYFGPRRFLYDRVIEGLVGEKWNPPIMARFENTAQSSHILLQGTMRGQGKTIGHNERLLPLPDNTDRAQYLKKAEERILEVKRIKSAYRAATVYHAKGGPKKNQTKYYNETAVANINNKLERAIDNTFFQDLKTFFDQPTEEARAETEAEWRQWLKSTAMTMFNQQKGWLPQNAYFQPDNFDIVRAYLQDQLDSRKLRTPESYLQEQTRQLLNRVQRDTGR